MGVEADDTSGRFATMLADHPIDVFLLAPACARR
jgi:hypothetical protein